MATMHAMLFPEPNAPLQRVERDMPAPGRHEALVAVQACGVCHSDTITGRGLVPGLEYPRIPGHEVIGTIAAVLPSVVPTSKRVNGINAINSTTNGSARPMLTSAFSSHDTPRLGRMPYGRVRNSTTPTGKPIATVKSAASSTM